MTNADFEVMYSVYFDPNTRNLFVGIGHQYSGNGYKWICDIFALAGWEYRYSLSLINRMSDVPPDIMRRLSNEAKLEILKCLM